MLKVEFALGHGLGLDDFAADMALDGVCGSDFQHIRLETFEVFSARHGCLRWG